MTAAPLDLAAHIRRLVDEAPPLTPEQLGLIGRMIRAGRAEAVA